MDREVIEQKLESLHSALQRVSDKCPETAGKLVKDLDAQDIVALNLTMAVQLSIDIGSHIIFCTDFPVPTTMGQVFEILSSADIISVELAELMKKSVVFEIWLYIIINNSKSIRSIDFTKDAD